MDRGIYVNMPVMCLGKECDRCPDMDVVTEKTAMYLNDEPIYNISLKCSGLDRCLKISKMLEKKTGLRSYSDTPSGEIVRKGSEMCHCEKEVIRDKDGEWTLENEFDISTCFADETIKLSAGMDGDGFYLMAQDSEGGADWHPPFCPFCGRKLKQSTE